MGNIQQTITEKHKKIMGRHWQSQQTGFFIAHVGLFLQPTETPRHPKEFREGHLQQTNRQTDKQTNRQTDKQTNRQTDKQTNRQTNKQTNRQTDKQTNKHSRRTPFKKADSTSDRDALDWTVF